MASNEFTMATIGAELKRTQRRIQKAVVQGCRHAAVLSRNDVIMSIRETKPRAPVDTGQLARVSSWPITPIVEGGQTVGYSLESTLIQASVMEYGTRPFWPPLDPLVEWAKRKLRAQRPKRKRRKPGRKNDTGGPTRDEPENSPGEQTKKTKKPRKKRRPNKALQNAAKKMAGAVRFAISQRGIAPRGYYARASQKFGANWQRGVTRMLNKVTR